MSDESPWSGRQSSRRLSPTTNRIVRQHVHLSPYRIAVSTVRRYRPNSDLVVGKDTNYRVGIPPTTSRGCTADLGFLQLSGRRRGRGRSFDDAMVYRVTDELCVCRHTHLFKDARPIGTDGGRTQMQGVRDLADRSTRGHLPQHLEFPVGQPLVKRLRDGLIEVTCKRFGKRGTDIAPSGQDLPDALTSSSGALSLFMYPEAPALSIRLP
jgi:hypothetical protein